VCNEVQTEKADLSQGKNSSDGSLEKNVNKNNLENP